MFLIFIDVRIEFRFIWVDAQNAFSCKKVTNSLKSEIYENWNVRNLRSGIHFVAYEKILIGYDVCKRQRMISTHTNGVYRHRVNVYKNIGDRRAHRKFHLIFSIDKYVQYLRSGHMAMRIQSRKKLFKWMFMKNKQWRAASLRYAPIHAWSVEESFAKGLHTFTKTESVWLKYTLKRFVHNNWRSVVRTAKFIGDHRDEILVWHHGKVNTLGAGASYVACHCAIGDVRWVHDTSSMHKRNTSRVCRRMCAVILFHTFAIGKFQYSY